MSDSRHFPAKSIHLTQVSVLATGIDGGHTYIKGRGDVPGEGEQDIYAYFKSAEEEVDFERRFAGQPLVIEGDSLEVTPSHSAAIRCIISWRFDESNHIAGVAAGRTPEFVEKMRACPDRKSGSPRLGSLGVIAYAR